MAGSDEIEIDFSKITGIFSRKPKAKEATPEAASHDKAGDTLSHDKQAPEEPAPIASQKTETAVTKDPDRKGNDDEVSIDFGKIASFFSGGEKKQEPKAQAAAHKARPSAEPLHAKEDDDTVDVGKIFSGIKSAFKGSAQKSEKEEDEVTVDIRKAAAAVNRFLPVILIIIAVYLAVYFRMLGAGAPFTDEWASSSVTNFYRNQIATQINQQYPNLPDANKNTIIEEELAKALAQNRAQFDEQIRQTSEYFKLFYKDNDGKLYMPDIDPYYWYRYANNIVTKGGVGDTVNNGQQWDNHQVAPIGRGIANTDLFHSYFLAYFYKVIKIFNPAMDLMQSMFYYPVLISALTVIPLFFIGQRAAGNVGGFFAAAMAAINPAFLNRTLFGHADSDAWVIFFPVLITWLFIEAFEARSRIKQIGLSALGGIFVGIFSAAWGGWWYIFDFLIATVAAYLVFYGASNLRAAKNNLGEILRKPEFTNAMLILLVFIIMSLASVTVIFSQGNLLNGLNYATSTPLSAISFTRFKDPAKPDLWPNVLTTVAELNEGNLSQIVSSVGGNFLFFLALCGTAIAMTGLTHWKRSDRIFLIFSFAWYLLVLRVQPNQSVLFIMLLGIPLLVKLFFVFMEGEIRTDAKLALLMFIWFVGTVYASTKGIRFTLLLVPAFSLALGVGVGVIYRKALEWGTVELHLNRRIVAAALIILFCSLFFMPRSLADKNSNIVNEASSIATHDVPIINDAWYASLMAIKENSTEDAIITSWWDFGHHFKAIADRPVTFDGTTQDWPQAHWVGLSLMTPDEDFAVGILRMLDCGGSTGFDAVNAERQDTHKSIDILYDLLPKSRDAAFTTLTKKYGFSAEKANNVLGLTHCTPPQGYYITSEDMVGKSGVWAHFGSWNFERSWIWRIGKTLPEDDAVEYMISNFNYSRETALGLYDETRAIPDDATANSWIAPWPSYAGISGCTTDANNTLTCNFIGLPLTIDLGTMDAYIKMNDKIAYPASFGYTTQDSYKLKIYQADNYWTVFDADFKARGQSVPALSLALKQEGASYSIIIMSPELAGSMFTRLYYYDGHGLTHFKLLSHQTGVVGNNIYVWSMDWNGTEPNILSQYQKKEAASSGDTASVSYIGYFADGTVFDSSIPDWMENNVTYETPFAAAAGSPLTFTLGAGQVIPGFDEGITGMKIKETKVVKVLPEKGYTEPGHPLFNQTLYFKVRLESVQ